MYVRLGKSRKFWFSIFIFSSPSQQIVRMNIFAVHKMHHRHIMLFNLFRCCCFCCCYVCGKMVIKCQIFHWNIHIPNVEKSTRAFLCLYSDFFFFFLLRNRRSFGIFNLKSNLILPFVSSIVRYVLVDVPACLWMHVIYKAEHFYFWVFRLGGKLFINWLQN